MTSVESKCVLFIFLVIYVTMLYFAILEDNKLLHEMVQCGKKTEGKDPRMDRRKKINVGIWPWHVSVLYQPNSLLPSRHICSGVLIHEYWIMTAAACIDGKERLLIRAGSHSLDVDDESTQQAEVTRIVIHKKYNPVTLRYSIALLKLKTPFVFNKFVFPICVPDKAAIRNKPEACYITGYNLQPGDHFGLLQEASVFGLPLSLCSRPEFWDYAVAADMICAGSFAGDGKACEENLGGPLVCFTEFESHYFIVGIRVMAASCGDPILPDVYLKVSYNYRWIHDQLLELEETLQSNCSSDSWCY